MDMDEMIEKCGQGWHPVDDTPLEDVVLFVRATLAGISYYCEHIANGHLDKPKFSAHECDNEGCTNRGMTDNQYMAAADEWQRLMVMTHNVSMLIRTRLLTEAEFSELARRNFELQTGQPTKRVEIRGGIMFAIPEDDIPDSVDEILGEMGGE